MSTPEPTEDSDALVEGRARLERARQGLEDSLTLSSEQARTILEARARELARPMDAQATGDTLEVVKFALGREEYALETSLVLEVIAYVEPTPVPGVLDALLGVVNLRGEVLPVFDLRRVLNVPPRGLSDGRPAILILGVNRAEFGLVADAVHEVTALPTKAILEPSVFSDGTRGEYLSGVTAEALIVLNGQAMLADTRLYIDQADDFR